jgi:hypothetical protein
VTHTTAGSGRGARLKHPRTPIFTLSPSLHPLPWNGTAREIGAEEIDNYLLRLVSWRVATRPKAAEKE